MILGGLLNSRASEAKEVKLADFGIKLAKQNDAVKRGIAVSVSRRCRIH